MKISRDSMVIYRSFYDAIKELPEKNQLEILKQIFEFGLDGIESELTGISKTIWILIKPNLEANRTKWESGCKAKKKQSRSKAEAKPKQEASETEANVDVDVDVDENEDVEKYMDIDLKRAMYGGRGKRINFDLSVYQDYAPIIKKWIDYKKSLKESYKSQMTLDIFVRKLKDLSGDNILIADSIIEQSMAYQWKGIFTLQNKKEATTFIPAESRPIRVHESYQTNQ
jgi:hypothetical protein